MRQGTPARAIAVPGLDGAVLATGVAFLFIYLVGLGLAASAPLRHGMSGALADAVKAGLHHPDAARLATAALDLSGYLGLTLLQPFTLIAAFTLVEIWLAGPPASWPGSLRSLLFRAVQTMVNTAVMLGFARLFSLGIHGPLINLQPPQGASLLLTALTSAVLVVLAVVLQDLAFYWSHRLQHRYKLLWRFHAVHHSIEHLDAPNNYIHPVDHALPMVFAGAIGAVIGLNYTEFLILTALWVIHDHFIHSRAPLHLGRLRALVVDNRYHHFHHSRNAAHFNMNFAAYFTLWDRIFGTCHIPADDEMPRTGIDGTAPAPSLWRYLTARLGPDEDSKRP